MKVTLAAILGVIIPAILLVGCGRKQKAAETETRLTDTADIKVGMTYDQVEKWLGKPASVEAGAEEIDFNHPTGPELAEMDLISRCRDSVWYNDPARLTCMPKMYKAGVNLYVSWKYPGINDIKKCFIIRPRPKGGFDRIPVEIEYTKSVVFNLASGKVINAGYLPTAVTQQGRPNP